MFCNGDLLPISDYQKLYSVIGTTFGGDGVSTFAIPDTSGLFLRSHNAKSTGNNVGVSIGTVQGDAIRNIYGSLISSGCILENYGGASGALSIDPKEPPVHGYHQETNNGYRGDWYFSASRVVPTADENRPVNMTLPFIIKVK